MTQPQGSPVPYRPPRTFAVTEAKDGLIVRAAWFVFVGWWLSLAVMLLGHLLVIATIAIPLALMVFNRALFAASLYRY